MQSSAWVALFQHIPEVHQNRLMVVTTGGIEIPVQSFLRIEQEFIAIKGRLAGTQDVGRVFFIPYAKIDYFGFLQEVKDSEFNSLFGELTIPDHDQPPSMASNGQAPAPVLEGSGSVSAVPGAVAGSVPTPGQSESGVRPTIRSEVLERYRSRPGQP